MEKNFVPRKYAWNLLKDYFLKCIENSQDPELENVVTQMREWESEHEASETN